MIKHCKECGKKFVTNTSDKYQNQSTRVFCKAKCYNTYYAKYWTRKNKTNNGLNPKSLNTKSGLKVIGNALGQFMVHGDLTEKELKMGRL